MNTEQFQHKIAQTKAVNPPDFVWDNIAQHLNKKRRRNVVWIWILTSGILAGVAGYLYFADKQIIIAKVEDKSPSSKIITTDENTLYNHGLIQQVEKDEKKHVLSTTDSGWRQAGATMPKKFGRPVAPSWRWGSNPPIRCVSWALINPNGRLWPSEGCWQGAAAGIYITNSPNEVKYIVDHAEAPVILLEDEGQWNKIKQVRGEIPTLKHVAMMKGAPKIDDPMVMSWEAFQAKGNDVPESQVGQQSQPD